MEKEMKDWIKKIENLKLPRWNELPDFNLYSDQVLEYVNDTIGLVFFNLVESDEKLLTSSMINNYVKNRIMPPPNKKRYNKDHIAFIITITILKQVGNLTDISQGIMHLTTVLGKVDAYNEFVKFLENALKKSILELEQKQDLEQPKVLIDLNLLPLKTATQAFASIMMSKYLLKEIKSVIEGERK